MIEDLAGRFERRLVDDRDQVLHSGRLVDCPVEAADSFAGDPRPDGMRVEDDRVAGRQHAHHVAGQRRQRVGDGRDRADHAERGVLGHGQPVVAAVASHLRNSIPGTSLTILQLLDLVIEAADLRLFEFQPAQLVGLLIANPIDASDGLGPIGQRPVAESLEAFRRGGHRIVDRAEHAPIAVGVAVTAVRCSSASQLGEHLLHHLPDGLFVGLDHERTLSQS